MIHHIPDSSTIAWLSWVPETNELLIRFKNDQYYEYSGVNRLIWSRLISAESTGAEFSKTIRKHPELFPYRKLDISEPAHA